MNSFRAASLCLAVAFGLVPGLAVAQGPATNLTAINARLTTLEATVATLQAALLAETNARIAAVAALQSSITSEANFRATADAGLDGRITAESAARASADTAQGGRVAKLEGNITADDLIGTYKATGFITKLTGAGTAASVEILTVNATFTLSAGGTGTFQQIGAGIKITQTAGSWGSSQPNASGGPFPLTWSYAGGTLHVNVGGFIVSDFNVGAGGRVLNLTERTTDPSADLFVAVRLQ